MLFQQDPVASKLDEVVSLICDDTKEEPLGVTLLGQNRISDYFPIPHSAPTYKMEWTHKKGKRKPQQFWIYCEESQQNYVRVEFSAPGFYWQRDSGIYHLKNQPDILVFSETSMRYPGEHLHCLYFNKQGNPMLGVRHMDPSLLVPISPSDLSIRFEIKADNALPIHPHQGKPEEVSIDQDIIYDKEIPFPFCFIGKFTFKNREEGWFQLVSTLIYRGESIFSGTSDLFMFNNPRMKKKKHLSAFTPLEIKFMQVYSIGTTSIDQDYWFDLAMQLGFGSCRSWQLLSLANEIFGKPNSSSSSSSKSNNSSTVNLPKVLMPTPSTPLSFLPQTSQSKKRPPFTGIPTPATKRPLYNPPVYSRSLPLPPLANTNSGVVSQFNPLRRDIQQSSLRRADSGPASSPSRTLPSADVVLTSLIQCQEVTSLAPPPISIYYKCLSSDMTILSGALGMVQCSKSISIDQLIIKIDQLEKSKFNGIRHLYGLQQNNVVELMDTMDLHALLMETSNPVILVSCHDDQSLPSRLLFSMPAPKFQPKRTPWFPRSSGEFRQTTL